MNSIEILELIKSIKALSKNINARLDRIEDRMDQKDKRIANLEDNSKCFYCKDVLPLYNCHRCQKKVCDDCSVSFWPSSSEIRRMYLCKQCK